MNRDEAIDVLSRTPYFDVHGHREGLLPLALRIMSRGRMPRDIRLRDVAAARVRGLVVCALGDVNSFKRRKRDEYAAVLEQFEDIRGSVASAGASLAAGPEELGRAFSSGGQAFVLGIEGGDFLGEDLDRLDAVHAQGCRLLGLVHYSKNALASISFGWGGRIVPESEQTGLTAFGRRVIARANDLGVMIDLAHADEPSIRGALDASRAPILCSHTGPRALQDFPRYISDDAMRGIARGGGIVGLWPFLNGRSGVPDLATFGAYCARCAELVGAEHLAIGSDVNGVPGYMAGYAGLPDAWKIVATLDDAGFSRSEIKGIVGGNFLALFSRVAAGRRSGARPA